MSEDNKDNVVGLVGHGTYSKLMLGTYSAKAVGEVHQQMYDHARLTAVAEMLSLDELDRIYTIKTGQARLVDKTAVQLNQELERIEVLLPNTFYADREVEFRVGRLVDTWQSAVRACESLETENERLRQLLEANDIHA